MVWDLSVTTAWFSPPLLSLVACISRAEERCCMSGYRVELIMVKMLSASTTPSAVLYSSFTAQHQPNIPSSFAPAAFLLYIEQYSPPPTHAHQLCDRTWDMDKLNPWGRCDQSLSQVAVWTSHLAFWHVHYYACSELEIICLLWTTSGIWQKQFHISFVLFNHLNVTSTRLYLFLALLLNV